jgi:hypothetical protein
VRRVLDLSIRTAPFRIAQIVRSLTDLLDKLAAVLPGLPIIDVGDNSAAIFAPLFFSVCPPGSLMESFFGALLDAHFQDKLDVFQSLWALFWDDLVELIVVPFLSPLRCLDWPPGGVADHLLVLPQWVRWWWTVVVVVGSGGDGGC